MGTTTKKQTDSAAQSDSNQKNVAVKTDIKLSTPDDPIVPEAKRNIWQKLHFIQNHVSGLAKDAKNGVYDYTTGNKILEHVKPLMNKLGLLLKTELLSIKNERQDYTVTTTWNNQKTVKNKSEILTTCEIRFTWVDIETGDTDVNLFGANGMNDWDKGVGSALTYAERYFLLKYFHIQTDKDDIDNPEHKEDAQAEAAPAQPNSELKATEILIAAAQLEDPKKGQIKEPTTDEKVRVMNNVPATEPTTAIIPEEIKTAIKDAKEFKEVVAIYNANLNLASNPEFVAMLSERRKFFDTKKEGQPV